MRKAITETLAAKTRPPETGRLEIYDLYLPGFVLRVTANGARSFAVMGRLYGKRLRVTLGRYPLLKVRDAREKARAALNAIKEGRDPRRLRRERADTFKEVSEEYIARHVDVATRPSSAYETKRHLRKIGEEWNNRPLHSITRRDVIELLDKIADERGPIASNRARAALLTMFAWAMRRDIIPSNPCDGVKPVGKETARAHFLKDEDIRLLWLTSDALGYPVGAFCKLLVLTGQRRTEVGAMTWAELDEVARTWTLRGERTKSGRPHVVPLSTAAWGVLERLARGEGDYVFSTTAGKKPFVNFSAAKRLIDEKAAEIAAPGFSEPWRFHDLRHTVATGLAALRVPREVVSAVLNHRDISITARYTHHRFDAEKRAALEAWGKHVLGMVEADDGRNEKGKIF